MNTFIYQILLEVAKERNLTRAAINLHITPSAVSHAISTYEKELGFPLFLRRRADGVLPTKEGTRILGYARSILSYEEALSQTVSEINGIEKGTVVLGAFTSVHMNWTADILSTFKARYPNIEVLVYESNYATIQTNLQAGTYDLGFTTKPSGALRSTKVFQDPWMCIHPNSLRTKSNTEISIEELDWSQLILPNVSYNDEIIAFLKKHRIKADAKYFIDDVESVYTMVAKGLGFALFPKLMLKSAPKGVRILPIAPRETRSIYLSSASRSDMSPAAAKMYDHIVEYMRSLPAMEI